MIAECRDDEIRADARGGDKDGVLENTSFDSGWRMKREGCWHRAIVKVRETQGQIKIWKVQRRVGTTLDLGSGLMTFERADSIKS